LARAFVTGATGFIGSHLVETLLKKNYEVICIVRKSSNLRWLEGKPVKLVYGGLFDNETLENAIKDTDYIYHVAGVTFSKKREEFYRGNVDATRNLLEITARVNPELKRFIHISSQAAVGPSFDGKPIDETRDYHPISTYGRSKVEAEKLVISYFDKLNCSVVRPPSVYGPRDYAVFEFFKSMNRGLQPQVGFGKKLVSLIHVYDLVDGIILAGESEKSKSNIYFVSSEKFYDWDEVGSVAQKVFGRKTLKLKIPHFVVYIVGFFAQIFGVFSSKPVILNLEKVKEVTQKYWICSVDKAKRDLGYHEKLTLEEGFRNTVEWYKSNGWLK